MKTDLDYADMVNPIGRMEREAEERGFRNGLMSGIFAALCGLIGIGMLLVALDARAAPAPWSFEEARKPIKASERDARIVVCQNNAVRLPWHCFSVL